MSSSVGISDQDAAEAVCERQRELIADIARHGHDDDSAVDAVREIRRDL